VLSRGCGHCRLSMNLEIKMKSTSYSEKVLDHFRKPRNVGTLEGEETAKGRVGNPVCGDLMEFYIEVKDNRLVDIKFKTFGCGSAVATASMITEMAKGKTLEEALSITRNDVADELDGLPPVKMHCSNLAADALRDAIQNYQQQHGGPVPEEPSKPTTPEEIRGEKDFIGRGVWDEVRDPLTFKDQRVIVIDKGSDSLETVLHISEHTPRAIFVTASKSLTAGKDLKTRVKQSDVKVLFESRVLEVSGFNSVEKIRIHDLNEDNEYDLFADALVDLK